MHLGLLLKREVATLAAPLTVALALLPRGLSFTATLAQARG